MSELVSIVLLSHNRPEYLREALTSLVEQSYENLQITVVDNPSPSSSEIAQMVGNYPTVKLIQNSTNLGYTGGMNRGIEQATGDYVFLTEDDIVLERDCIQRLAEYLEKHPSADLTSPIIYNKTSNTIYCAGGDFELGGVYRKQVFGAGETDVGQFPDPFKVNYVDGATMFVRREFWQHFKGFREEYFMYVDAVELCARVRKSGKNMVIVPEAKVYHFETQERLNSPEIEFHKLKNFFSLYLLHASMWTLPEFFCRYAGINAARTLLGRNGNRRQPFFTALLWLLRNGPSLLKERHTNSRHSVRLLVGTPGTSSSCS